MKYLIPFLALILCLPASGQDSIIDWLEVQRSSYQGIDTTARDALTAVAGDVIYNTTNTRFEWYNGSAWGALGGTGAPTDATYLTTSANGSLSAEVVVSALSGNLTIAGNDAAARTITFGQQVTNADVIAFDVPIANFTIGGVVPATVSGTQTLTNKTLTTPALTLTQSAAPTPTAEGVIEWDSDDNVLKIGDGATTVTLSPAAGAWEHVSSQTASASTQLDFTDLSATYTAYMFVLEDLLPSTDDTAVRMFVSTDNGSTFKTGASDYAWIAHGIDTTADVSTSSSGSTVIQLTPTGVGTAAGEDGVCGTVMVVRPNSTAKTKIMADLNYFNASTELTMARSGAVYKTAGATNALRFKFSTGNITSGKIHLYRLKES